MDGCMLKVGRYFIQYRKAALFHRSKDGRNRRIENSGGRLPVVTEKGLNR